MATNHQANQGEEPSRGGGLRRLARRRRGAAPRAGNEAAAAGVHGWPVRARGADGWRGAEFCVQRWRRGGPPPPGGLPKGAGRRRRLGRAGAAPLAPRQPVAAALPAQILAVPAFSLCAHGGARSASGPRRGVAGAWDSVGRAGMLRWSGWCRAAGEMCVRGPHGRGTLLRPWDCPIDGTNPRCRAAGGDTQTVTQYGLYTASPSSHATWWLRAGGAPCGRLTRKPRSNQTASKAPKQSCKTKHRNKADKPVCSSTCCLAFIGLLIPLS